MKTKLFISLFFCLAIIVQCKKSDTVLVKINVKDSDHKTAVLVIGEDEYNLESDDKGIASLVIAEIDMPKYALLMHKSSKTKLFLEPGNEVEILFSAQKDKRDKILFDGDNASINTYLNSRRLKRFDLYKKTDKTLFSNIDDCIESNINDLESRGFKDNFVKIEKEKIRYKALECVRGYYKVHIYPSSRQFKDYQFSPYFFKKLESYFSDDESLLQLKEYKDFMLEALYIKIAGKRKEYNEREITIDILDYILNEFKNPKVVEYLVHTFSLKYVDQFGMDDTEKIVTVYNSSVNNTVFKKEFLDTYNKWSAVAKGKKSPSFTYNDINGKQVSLDDLKGKYIYIDMWATWCGPCCAEIPSLQKLEKEFHGKNIQFLSISTDKDVNKWKAKVIKDNLGGIQLNTGGDKLFKAAYSIYSIPRFILLDKEGKILDANCSRPSDPKTKETLKALSGM